MIIDENTCKKLGIKLWYKGKDFSIYYSDNPNPTALDIVGILSDSDQRKTRAFLESLKDNAKVLSLPNKSKQISNNLYRLKTTDQLRFMYFRDENNMLIITHAFIKKTDQIDTKEINKAERIKAGYYTNKGS